MSLLVQVVTRCSPTDLQSFKKEKVNLTENGNRRQSRICGSGKYSFCYTLGLVMGSDCQFMDRGVQNPWLFVRSVNQMIHRLDVFHQCISLDVYTHHSMSPKLQRI